MSDRTLITGFGPFLDIQDNPSAILAEGSDRHFAILPVAYRVVDEFIAELDPTDFDRWLMLGLGSQTPEFRIELFGRNECGVIPDVEEVVRGPGKIWDEGPELLGSTLFNREEVLQGVPGAMLSPNAGAYLCNYALFQALRAFPALKIGFLHVPSFDILPQVEQEAWLAKFLSFVEGR